MTEKDYEANFDLADQSGIQLWDVKELVRGGMVIVEPYKKPANPHDDEGDNMRVWYVGNFNWGRFSGPCLFDLVYVEFEVDRTSKDKDAVYSISGSTFSEGSEKTRKVDSLGISTSLVNPESRLTQLLTEYRGRTNSSEDSPLSTICDALRNPEQARKYEVMERAKEAHDAYQAILTELRTQAK